MRFGHVELFVADPLATMEFYRDVLGFDLVAIQGEGRAACVWLKISEVEILLRPARSGQDGDSYRDAHAAIVLYTDDLEAERGRLATGGLAFAGNDGSDREPTFKDPDGHWFQLVNPADFT